MELDAVGRATGVVKIYYPLKGFGFITREKGRDLFFYRSAFEDEAAILDGAIVSFRVEQSQRGPKAMDIARIG